MRASVVLEPCFELRALDRASALALSACCGALRSCFYEGLYRNQLHGAGVRTRRTFFRLIQRMRGMGVLPLFSLLHVRRAEVLLCAFERYTASQWALASPSKFFEMDTHKPPLWRSPRLWSASRDYLQLLHNAAANRHLFATMALCASDPEHAAKKYGLDRAVLEASDASCGKSVLESLTHQIPAALWPVHALRLLLRALEVRPSPLWREALDAACANLSEMLQRRALRVWGRATFPATYFECTRAGDCRGSSW